MEAITNTIGLVKIQIISSLRCLLSLVFLYCLAYLTIKTTYAIGNNSIPHRMKKGANIIGRGIYEM